MSDLNMRYTVRFINRNGQKVEVFDLSEKYVYLYQNMEGITDFEVFEEN